MESIYNDVDTQPEIEYAAKLNQLGYLPGPEKCECGNIHLVIEIDNNYKTSKVCFRCNKSNCRRKYNIRTNSFFSEFPKIRLLTVSEVINCILCYNFNIKESYKYLNDTLKMNISKHSIREIYKKVRFVLYRYLYIYYRSELLATKNENQNIALDESLFTHGKDGSQIWIIGAINTITKEFRIEPIKERNSAIIKTFITSYIEEGNHLICDGWGGYNVIDQMRGYTKEIHNHGAGDFGIGIHSTSYIESLWKSLKDLIKKTYNMIPNIYFTKFLREAEWKYLNRNKTNSSKIKEFFEDYTYINNLNDIILNENDFLSDSDINDLSDDEI